MHVALTLSSGCLVSAYRKRAIYRFYSSVTYSRLVSSSRAAGKRKSAVELLQETKAFYVKSETVLDRKQELKNSGHLQVSQLSAPSAPPRLLRKCGNTSACSMQPTSPSQLPPAPMTPPCCWASCHEQDRRKSLGKKDSMHTFLFQFNGARSI